MLNYGMNIILKNSLGMYCFEAVRYLKYYRVFLKYMSSKRLWMTGAHCVSVLCADHFVNILVLVNVVVSNEIIVKKLLQII